MESVDTQDVKALSNDHIRLRDVSCCLFQLHLLYGWVEFNLLMLVLQHDHTGPTGIVCLIGLFQMHKTPVDLTTCHYSIRFCRELQYLIKKTNIKIWFVHSDHLSWNKRPKQRTPLHFVRSLFGNCIFKSKLQYRANKFSYDKCTHHTLNTHSTKEKKCVC